MFQSWLGAIFHVEQATRGAKLLATEYKLEESREQHWKKSREFFCFKNTQNTHHIWKTLAFEVIVSCQTQLPGLCVLLCNSDDISGDVTVAVSMVNKNICSYGNVPATMVPSDGAYHLNDGPSVLWCSGSQLAMLSANSDNVSMTLHCFSLEQLFNIDTSTYLNLRLDKLWILGGQQAERNLTVLMRTTSTTSLQDANPPKKLKTTDTNILLSTVAITHQEQAPTVTKLENNLIIHSDYVSVISCVTAYDIHDSNLLGDQQRSLRYIVGTTYQQMLMFGDGKVLHCTSLEYVPIKITACQV